MEYLDFTIEEDVQRAIENHELYDFYYKECWEEFEIMDETKIYDNVSVFRILMGSEKEISRYARNEKLVETLEIRDEIYEIMFPIYFNSLKTRFSRMVEKQRLRGAAARNLSNLFMFNDPAHLVIDRILCYLTDKDMRNLCSDGIF